MLSLCQPERRETWEGWGSRTYVSPETLQGARLWTPESALFLPKGWFGVLRTPGEAEALDNARNLAKSDRDSLSSEQEQEELAGGLVQPAGETQLLLVSGGGHARSWPLCWPRTVSEAGKGQCWSGLLSWGRMVQGDQDLRGWGCTAGSC